MIIKIDQNTQIDTEKDLTPEERHVIQKLFGWREFAESLDQFREKTSLALKDGWNKSGPIRRSATLNRVILQLEKEVQLRISDKRTGK